MIRKYQNCEASICQLCPVCNRKREWREWLFNLSSPKRIEVQLALVCPAEHITTSLGSDPELVMKDWCNQCQKYKMEEEKK
jgi:hypothetical protein